MRDDRYVHLEFSLSVSTQLNGVVASPVDRAPDPLGGQRQVEVSDPER